MPSDRRLSHDFWLHEFSGWEHATPAEVAQLEETVARVLQPIRTAFGVRVVPSSWLTWSNGLRRTGSHGHGAVDFVVADGRTREAHAWAAENLVPGGYIGRLIYEPARSASEGEPQGEHVHLAPRASMLAFNGDGSIQVLEERAEGEYVFARVAVATLTASALVAAGIFFLASRRPVGAT